MDLVPRGRAKLRLQRSEPRLPSAVGRAENRHGAGIDLRCISIDNLRDQAAEIAQLDVEIGKVHLSPGLAESSGGVPQHRVPAQQQLVIPTGVALLAPTVPVQVHDQREGRGATGDLQGYVQRRPVDVAGEEARAFHRRGGSVAREPERRPGSGEETGPRRIGAERVLRRQRVVREQRKGRESCEQADERKAPSHIGPRTSSALVCTRAIERNPPRLAHAGRLR